MPNSIKYSTSTPQNALQKGNVAIGINDVDMGPTSITGWYNSITPSVNNITIYKTSTSNIPLIFSPQSDDELYRFVIDQGGTSGDTTSLSSSLSWIATQSNLFAANIEYENIVTDGLVLNLDASVVSSYPMTNNTIYDLSGEGSDATKQSGVDYSTSQLIADSDEYGNLLFDGSSTGIVPFSAAGLTTTATVEMWCKIGTGYSGKMFCGWGSYDVYCGNSAIGYNTGNGDVHGISQTTVDSLGIVDTWAHYIFEFRSDVSYTNNKIYINGVNQSLTQQTGTEAAGNRNFNSGNGKIASWGGGGYQMPMECAVFRVYNKSLSQDEITHNYNSQKGRYQNFFRNGNFQFGNLNYSSGTENTTTTLPGSDYSLQMPQVWRNTFSSNNYVEVDTSKSYRMVVQNRTLSKGGSGNNVLSGGHTGYMTFDESFRFIDLRNCGGLANTYLTRDLNPGDAYAYVSNQNNNWRAVDTTYYYRHFMIYPPSHPEFSTPWEYTRIGYQDNLILYNEITDIGGGELKMRFANSSGQWVTFPNIGYPTPTGTPIMNGVAGGTYSYVFYPTTAAYGEWSTYTSGVWTGENRNSGIPFRYATKYIKFLHLINYSVPSGTSPLPIMLFGDVTLEQVQV